MFSAGNILLIKDFQFSNGDCKDKFMIIIYNHEGKYVISTLTSSQVYVNVCDVKEGCLRSETKHCYHFPKGKVIGENGFSFKKSTFVYFMSNIRAITIEELKKYLPNDIEVVTKLTDKEYLDILYFSYKGDLIAKRVRKLLEAELERLHTV